MRCVVVCEVESTRADRRMRLPPAICRFELSIAESVTLICCFPELFMFSVLDMYCILFRVSVCFGFGIVYAGCLHDLPAKGHHIEQHTNDNGQQKQNTTTLNTFDL